MSKPDVLALRGKWTQALIPNPEVVLCLYIIESDFVFIGYFCMCMQVSTYICVFLVLFLRLYFSVCLLACLVLFRLVYFYFNISLFVQMPVCFLISKSKKGCGFECVEEWGGSGSCRQENQQNMLYKNIYNKNEGKKRELQLVKTQRSSEHWMSSPNRHMRSIAAMFKAQKHHRRG